MNLKHSIFLVLLTLLACSDENENLDHQYGSWKALNDHPGSARVDAMAFSLSGKGYWGMGSDDKAVRLRDIWSYDPDSDSWTRMKDFPVDLSFEAAVTIENRAYVMTFGGALYEYNPDADSWRLLPAFPKGSRQGLTGFAVGGKAYFGAGKNADPFNSDVCKDFWEYNPSNNTWREISRFPGVSRTAAISFVIGNKGYVGLGDNGLGAPPVYNDVWSFDAATGNWSRIQDFPYANSLIGITFANNSNAYVGFPAHNGLQGIMYEYSPTSNSWRNVKSFPSANSLFTCSFVIHNRAYVIGGWSMQYTKEVWEFVP